MPRKAREKSSVGIYAVVLKGNGDNSRLFRDDEDYNEFIDKIEIYLGDAVMAFSLCENIVCMIVKESENGIGRDIKPLTTSYAAYCRKRRGIKGGVFERRFKSFPIETAPEFASQLACVHKLGDIIGKESYVGLYTEDEFILTEDTLKFLGGRKLYDDAMAKTDSLTPFFSRIINADKESAGRDIEEESETTAENKAEPSPESVAEITEKAPEQKEEAEKKPAENKTSENKEIENKEGENKKGGSKNGMPLWLL